MRLLVATDLSPAGDEALRQACLRMRAGDTLAVMSVIPSEHAVSGLLAGEEPTRKVAPAELHAQVERALRKKVAECPAPDAEVIVDEGSAYVEIVKRSEAWRTDLVVVGSHGHSGLARWLGGVAERVVRHAACDVLVARASTSPGRVLAATDLSELSRPALTAGVAEANRRGTTLEIVHAVGFLDLDMLHLTELGRVSAAPLAVDPAREQLEVFARATGVTASCKVLDGSAAAAVVREAEETGAALIVVGSHGKTGLKRFLIGNIAEKIVHNASCSVLVARAHS